MAQIVLNRFTKKYYNLTNTLTGIYRAPQDRAAIVLLAQISNITNTTHTVSFGISSDNRVFYLVKDMPVLPQDARAISTGKLVVDSGDVISLFSPTTVYTTASSNAGSPGEELTLVMSVLETLNT